MGFARLRSLLQPLVQPPLLLFALLALLALQPADAARKKLPSFIAKCPSAEPKELNACALDRARTVMPMLARGIPELKIPPMDPFVVERVVMEERGAQFVLTNLVIRNLFNTVITNVEVDLKEPRITIDYENPKTVSTAMYSFEGKIAGFPLSGNGNSSYIYHGIKAHYWAKLALKKNPKDGLEYAEIEDSFLTFTPTKVEYWFDNLFGGDQTLGNATNAMLNENWAEVFAETKASVIESMKELTRMELMRVLKDVPFNEAFPV